MDTIRTCVASSNYKTNLVIGTGGETVEKIVDAEYLLKEANEHFAEVFYGTFFADRTDKTGGVCATIYQAQQNYPKAVKADNRGLYVMLVPEGVGNVVMEPGMSREQKFLLHFHKPEESLVELDNRSLIYQMPDRPVVSADLFADAGIMPDIFVDKDKVSAKVELSLIGKCEWIIGQFQEWEEAYGGWISVYTDNTMIRVGFMIAVAVGSLMRYYRVFPRKDIKDMILRAVDDLVDNY